jgi:hypothetical protein
MVCFQPIRLAHSERVRQFFATSGSNLQQKNDIELAGGPFGHCRPNEPLHRILPDRMALLSSLGPLRPIDGSAVSGTHGGVAGLIPSDPIPNFGAATQTP